MNSSQALHLTFPQVQMDMYIGVLARFSAGLLKDTGFNTTLMEKFAAGKT